MCELGGMRNGVGGDVRAKFREGVGRGGLKTKERRVIGTQGHG